MYLDTEEVVSVVKKMLVLVFEIDSSDIHMVVTLIRQNTTVQLWIVILRSEIRCFGTFVFPLVLCLIDIVVNE